MPAHVEMDMGTYALLDESETRFDGTIARDHLQRRLGMSVLRVDGAAQADVEAFWEWHATRQQHLRLHSNGPHLIQAPNWWV